MYEIIVAGGPLMIPIVACSILALGIIVERFLALQTRRVLPANLMPQIWTWLQNDELDSQRIHAIHETSPLGRILASGLVNRQQSRELMKERIEMTGRQVSLELSRFLNTLGTITTISPLLGLLGTVQGMIIVFNVITGSGVGDPRDLAGGISTALITTVAGLSVAIPSLFFYRYFKGRVDMLITHMEQEAFKLVEAVYDEREPDRR